MPCVGLSPFLQQAKKEGLTVSECVNALCRAIPISTTSHRFEKGMKNSSVNALCRAIPISTTFEVALSAAFKGVNALCRAIPISTMYNGSSSYFIMVCQCPVSGYPHFYR